ncbi:hypothetical protein RRF57_005674 [Xylaria bambusicola]|uniref:non-chaperonin molecular chaperone ATPase n=1 Tax=Xylaria bambusicola TaxID=326684 RepID=A0AAN7UYD3_9PEZI
MKAIGTMKNNMSLSRRDLTGGTGILLIVILVLLFCPLATSYECHNTKHDHTIAIGIVSACAGNSYEDMKLTVCSRTSGVYVLCREYSFFHLTTLKVYSRVAYGQNASSLHIVPDKQGHTFIPSCVAFTKDGPLVGYAARHWSISSPETTICNPRALLGRRWSDPDVQTLIKGLPYEVLSDDQDKPMFKLNVGGEERIYAPEHVISLIIGELKRMAEASMGNNRTVTEAFVTIPNYFDYDQRVAFTEVGKIAGVEVIHVLSNPMAIIIAYDNDYCGNFCCDYAQEERNILVVDIGDTLDVTVLRYEDGYFETLGMSHAEIGGDVLNERVARYTIYKSLKELILDGIYDDIGDIILAGGLGQIVETVSREFPSKRLLKDLRAEATVIGAARQGALMILDEDLLYTPYIPDFSPLDLGIETIDGYMAVVAPQSILPFSSTFNISTAFDQQSTLLIRVLQGQRVIAADNRVIGELEIPVTLGPASLPRVEVLFQVDLDPSLHTCKSYDGRDFSKAFCNWCDCSLIMSAHKVLMQSRPDWKMESAEYDIDRPELRAEVDARFDLESYLTALHERVFNPEKWGVEDVLKYYTSGYPKTLKDVQHIFDGEWNELVVDREIWELKGLDEVKTLKQFLLHLTEPYFGKFEYEFIPKVGGEPWIRHDEL